MTNDKLREALEQIKANCFRSDITDHTALAGIAIIAKEALASTTVATAATDARAIVEACAKVAESEAPMSLFRSETCSEDMAAEYCFQAEYASWLAIELRAKADEIIAALPLPTPSAPDEEWEGDLTADEQAMIDAAWEKHKAAAPSTGEPTMTDDQIKHMVNRFLGWKLPDNFNPDGGIGFNPIGNPGQRNEYRNQPTGTNLFDYTQAEAMVRYLVDGIVTPSAPDAALREAVTILIEKRIPHGMDQWVRDLAWEVFALSNSGQMEKGA
ncbi:hypothetical protein TomTYG75_06710 [Sphingobium sp. TomTYG75]